MQASRFLTCIGCWVVLAAGVLAQDDVAQLAKQLESTDVQTRMRACEALTQLGVKAHAAVPQLTQAVTSDNPELQRCAALALAEIGEGAVAAVPALVGNLTAQDANVRAYSAEALGAIGPAARAATAALISALSDSDPTVRRVVRDALAALKPESAVAVPLFIKMLNSDTPADAATAVEALAELGVAAVPALTAALSDEDAAYWACLALSEIGAPAAPAVGELTKVLDSEQPEVRMEALDALTAIGQPSQSLASKICTMLEQDDTNCVRYAAAYALAKLGDKATALPALAKAMGSDDEFLRVTAAWAYVQLVDNVKSPELDQAVKIVVDGVSSDSHEVREMATRAFADPDVPVEQLQTAFVRALAGMEDPEHLMDVVDALASLGPKVVPMCVKSLEDKGPLRFYTLQLLIELGPDAAPAVAAVSATLDDADPVLRREAMFTLGAIGPASVKALDKIVAKLTDENEDVRAAACFALGKIGPGARAALPKLRELLDSGDEFMRMAAVWAALKMAPQDGKLQKQAVPYLIQGLTDEREHVRIEAAYLLGELGSIAKPAIPALQKAQEDTSEDMRTAVAAALEVLEK